MNFLTTAKNFLETQGKISLEVTPGVILSSLLLGSDLKLTPELLSQIKTTGTLYFFVISGLHFTILERVIAALLSALPISRTVRNSCVGVCLLIFGGIVGFSIPIVRTLVMHVYKLLGAYTKRRVSKKIVFVWMVAFIGVLAPFQVVPTILSVSFLLSFGAVFALLFFSKKSHASSLSAEIHNQLWAGLSVNVWIAPLLLYFFNAWNPMSLFFSVVFSPLITILIVLGFALLAWETVSDGLFSFLQPVSTLLVGSFTLIVRCFSTVLEYSERISWNITMQASVAAVCAYYVFLSLVLLIWWYLRKKYETDFL